MNVEVVDVDRTRCKACVKNKKFESKTDLALCAMLWVEIER
jgi:hypothetical protein